MSSCVVEISSRPATPPLNLATSASPQTSIIWKVWNLISECLCACKLHSVLHDTKMAESRSSDVSDTGTGLFSSDLHQRCGVDYASQFRVFDHLPPGWWWERKSPEYSVWYSDREKQYKSSVKVERALKEKNCFQPSAKSKWIPKWLATPETKAVISSVGFFFI